MNASISFVTSDGIVQLARTTPFLVTFYVKVRTENRVSNMGAQVFLFISHP